MRVAQIAKDTAGGSENTQKAAEDLSRLATELRELTLRFQYGDAQEPPAPVRTPQVLRGRNVPLPRGDERQFKAAS